MKFIKLKILFVLLTAASFGGVFSVIAYADKQRAEDKNAIAQLRLATSLLSFKESHIREEERQKQEYKDLMLQKKNEYLALVQIQQKEIEKHTRTITTEVSEVISTTSTQVSKSSSSSSSNNSSSNSGSSSNSSSSGSNSGSNSGSASPTPKPTAQPTPKPTPRPTATS